MMRVGSKVFQGIAAPNMPVVAGEQHGGAGTGKLGTVSGARTISVGGVKLATVSGGASGKSASSTAGLPNNLWYEVGVLWAMPPATSGGTPKQGSTQSIRVPYPIAFDDQSAFRQCMQANIQLHGARIEFPPGAGPYGASFLVASATSSASGMTSTCSYFAAVLGMAKSASNFVHSMGACFIDPEG